MIDIIIIIIIIITQLQRVMCQSAENRRMLFILCERIHTCRCLLQLFMHAQRILFSVFPSLISVFSLRCHG